MKAIVTSLKAALEDAGYTVHISDVLGTLTSSDYPYIVITGRVGDRLRPSLSRCADIDTRIRVTVADTTALNALDTGERVLADLETLALSVPGWRVFPVEVTPLTDVAVDRSVTMTDTNTHPAYLVLEARVRAVASGRG